MKPHFKCTFLLLKKSGNTNICPYISRARRSPCMFSCSPTQLSLLGCLVYPGAQMHMYVPIRFLQVIPLDAQSSRPSSHSFWSDEHKRSVQTWPCVCVCDAERVVFTFAHPAVFSQNVSGWTSAFVRAHRVDAAERTQQRILGTLVDI